jgi:lipoyl(octanoyl) transferase
MAASDRPRNQSLSNRSLSNRLLNGPDQDPCRARKSLKLGMEAVAGEPATHWHVESNLVPYGQALAVMDARAAAIADARASELVWLVEHPPLYTAGTSAKPADIKNARFPVHAAGRGGELTYHGPGQRIAYVMLDLAQRGPDVRRYVATLEEWIIRSLAAFAIAGERREDRIGVWVSRPDKGAGREDKIAAIGIRVKRWISLHGIALNVDCDLSHFAGIVPCGISDPRYGVTSLRDLGLTATISEVDAVLRREFEFLFGATVESLPTSPA